MREVIEILNLIATTPGGQLFVMAMVSLASAAFWRDNKQSNTLKDIIASNKASSDRAAAGSKSASEAAAVASAQQSVFFGKIFEEQAEILRELTASNRLQSDATDKIGDTLPRLVNAMDLQAAGFAQAQESSDAHHIVIRNQNTEIITELDSRSNQMAESLSDLQRQIEELKAQLATLNERLVRKELSDEQAASQRQKIESLLVELIDKVNQLINSEN